MTDFGFLLLIIVFLVCLVIFFVYLSSRKRKVSASDRKFFEQKWQGLLGYSDLQKSLLEADKLLDLALKKKGYGGSLGEKLKKSEKLFRNINEVWSAHKMRNRLAHQIGAKVNPQEAKISLTYFKRALEDLGYL